jgi:hypothetical protein
MQRNQLLKKKMMQLAKRALKRRRRRKMKQSRLRHWLKLQQIKQRKPTNHILATSRPLG